MFFFFIFTKGMLKTFFSHRFCPMPSACKDCQGVLCTDTQTGLCYAVATAKLLFINMKGSQEAVLTTLRLFMLFEKKSTCEVEVHPKKNKILHALAPVISALVAAKMVMPSPPPSFQKNGILKRAIQYRIQKCTPVLFQRGLLWNKAWLNDAFKICERVFLGLVDYRGLVITKGALQELKEYLCNNIKCNDKQGKTGVFAGVMQSLDNAARIIEESEAGLNSVV